MNKRERRGAGAGKGGATQSVRRNYESFKGDISDGFGRNAPVYHVYSVSRTTSEERVECSRGWGLGQQGFPTALCRIDVGVCYTRGARSR